MADDDIIRRLDTIIALLKLAHRDARADAVRDDVAREIISLTASEFVAAGDIKSKVSKATKKSVPTVERRLAELIALGALERRPTGYPAYRSTGVLDA